MAPPLPIQPLPERRARRLLSRPQPPQGGPTLRQPTLRPQEVPRLLLVVTRSLSFSKVSLVELSEAARPRLPTPKLPVVPVVPATFSPASLVA